MNIDKILVFFDESIYKLFCFTVFQQKLFTLSFYFIYVTERLLNVPDFEDKTISCLRTFSIRLKDGMLLKENNNT